MNDREQFVAMLERAGIPHDLADVRGEKPFDSAGSSTKNYASRLEVEAGYRSFYTHFCFDAEGALLYMGAWE